MAASAHFDLVQKIYIAFYQRPADPAGLLYWAEQIDLAGGSADSMIDNFGKSPEAISLFGAITAANIDAAIESIYQAAFSRPADAAGKAYWVGQFNAGVVSPTAIALAIVQGAQNADQTVITNKLTVANNFTAQIDGHAATDPAFGIGPFAVTYTATDAANARTILAVVTDSPATILTPEQITEQIRANIADPTDPISIQTFTLTTAAASVDEGHSTEFTVTAAFAVTADTVLSYATSSTSASAADFAGATAGTVTILAGQTTGTFSVAIAADNVAELAESFTVTLKDSTGAVVGTPKTIDINDAIVDLTAPVLTATSLVGTYAENSAAGQEVADLAADDVAATFAFAAGSNTDGYFAIDAATGKVTLTDVGAAAAAANDFETTPADSTFTLGVTATDAAGNVSDAANLVLTLTNLDDDAPVVSAATSSATKIVIAFNEALSTTAGVPAASAFAGTQNASGTVSNLNITNVSITGSTVELTLGTAVATGATVAVTYTQPATAPLVDAAGNKVATFTGQAVTLDTTAPTLASSTPADDAANVAVGSNVVLTFSETVKAGTGNITIVNSANAADTRTISVTDSTQVTVSGNTVTINPTADLLAAASYYVNVAPTALTDSLGNAFAGISSQTALNFATPGGGGTAGKTITLTQGADTVNTTTANTALQSSAGDDTINGFLDGGSATFSGSLDSVDGGGGIDTLVAYGQSGTTNLTNVTNVEVITVRTGAIASVDMSTAAGFTALTGTKLVNQGSAHELNFLKIGTTTTTLAVQGATEDTAFIHTAAALAGGSDTVNIQVDGYNASTKGLVLTAGIETLTIAATGAKSNFGIYTDDDGDGTKADGSEGSGGTDTVSYNSATTLNVTGTANLTIGNPMTGLKTVNLAQNSGGVKVDLTGNAQAVTVTGGSGNDNVTFTGTQILKTTGTADSINLGAGTGDVLTVAGALAAADYTDGSTKFLESVNAVVSNTEGLYFANEQVNSAGNAANVDASKYTNGIVNFGFTAAITSGNNLAAGSEAVDVTGLATSNTVIIDASMTGGNGGANNAVGQNAIGLTGASAGQTAKLTLTGAAILGGAGNANTNQAGNGVTAISGITKLVLTSSTDSANTTNSITGGNGVTGGTAGVDGYAITGVSNVELLGSTAIVIKGGSDANDAAATDNSNLDAGFAAGVSFDATAFTGTSTIYLSNDGTTGDVFLGGTAADKVFGLGGADNLSGNGGNDTLLGGAGTDTLSGGDGDDVLMTATFPVATNIDGSADVLTGGNGTDKFFIADGNAKNTADATIVTNAYTITDFNASGEKMYLSSKAAVDPTDGQELLGNAALTDLAWNATTGVTAADGKVINIGTLASVTGETNVAADLQSILSNALAAGKIVTAADNDFMVVFNSARDSSTYVAIINDQANAGWADADDGMTLIKLTGVAVADLSAADFGLVVADAATGLDGWTIV